VRSRPRQTHVSATTILIAFAAGVAGMLAVESRASAAVGVAISVTTIPASAYPGVAIGVGELDKAWSALGVLAVNIAMMLAGGSSALATRRLAAVRRERPGAGRGLITRRVLDGRASRGRLRRQICGLRPRAERGSPTLGAIVRTEEPTTLTGAYPRDS
jgi:hypothetical protein